MKNLILLSIALLMFINAYSQKQEIPFFGKVELKELCGSNNCLGSYGIKAYVHKNDKLYYNGDYNSILGRVFKKSIFDTKPSGLRSITNEDVDYFAEHKGTGKLEKNTKVEFDANLTANIDEILKNEIQLPEEFKIKLLTESKNTVSKRSGNTIDFSFRIIQLKNVGDIDKQLNEAFVKLEKGEKIITSISVVSISGQWTSNTLKEVFDNFELNAALNDKLSVESKLKYEKSKDLVLKGEVKEFSFIIGDTYKIKM